MEGVESATFPSNFAMFCFVCFCLEFFSDNKIFFSMVPDNKVKLAGVWLISAGLLNFGIAFLMYGERGIENRVLLFDIYNF